MTRNGKNIPEHPKNGQELQVLRNLAGAGGAFKTAEAEKRCSMKRQKESTNAKTDKFMIYKYFHAQFQLNAFVSNMKH